jgi:thiamine-phosphate pyrophosphorylase
VTDRGQAHHPLERVVESACAAGLRAVQLREKDLATRELLALAESLRAVTRVHGARLLINDRADVALAAAADGVQRTGASLPVSAYRLAVPEGFLVGASVHALDEAREAEAAGADFLVFGPVYDTPAKRPFGPPQGLEALQRVAAAAARPVLAIGGVTPARVGEVLAAGAAGVAVMGGISGAADPGGATRAYLDALGSA